MTASRSRSASTRCSALFVLLALIGAGCSASDGVSGGKSKSSANLVTGDQLPERHRAMLLAYGAGPATWQLERGQYVTDPVLANFLVDNLLIEMFRAYDSSRITADGQRVGPFERAQDELVRLAPFSREPLAEVLRTGDGMQAFLADDTLVRIGPEAVGPVTGLLTDRDPHARRRATETLASLPALPADDPLGAAALDALAKAMAQDPEWFVRGGAARALGARLAPIYQPTPVEPYRAALLAALDDPDPAVVKEVAAALVELRDGRLVPPLIDFLERSANEGDSSNLGAAQESLMEATGSRKKRSVHEWRRWWDEFGTDWIAKTDEAR